MGHEHEVLAPGQRLPDTIEVFLASGEVCMLHDLTYRAGHTALLIAGLWVHSDTLRRLETSIRARSGVSVIEATFALLVRSDDQDSCGRLAPAAAQQLGIDEITLFVIRPDGHIGLRADRDHLDSLAAYDALLMSGRS